MKYINAQNILPEELIQHIQEYIHGDYIYIPRKIGEQKKWGENRRCKIRTDNKKPGKYIKNTWKEVR